MNFGFDSLAFAFEVLCFICRAVFSMTDGGATHPQGMRGRRADNVAEGCSVVISPVRCEVAQATQKRYHFECLFLGWGVSGIVHVRASGGPCGACRSDLLTAFEERFSLIV